MPSQLHAHAEHTKVLQDLDNFEPLKFINNQWFRLFGHPETNTTRLCTRASTAIPVINHLGIGYWDITDPEHPDFTPGTIETIDVDPPENTTSAITVYINPPENTPAPQTHYNSPTPGLTIASTSTVTFPTTPSLTIVPTQTAPVQPTTMSASATRGRSGGGGGGGGGGAPATTAAPTPSNGGMQGIQPAIFDGTHALADDFWAQFRWYKMVNCTHNSMTKAYDRVLTALTYIRGPMVNDWVNTQENNLVTRTNTTRPNHVRKDDEVLWAEFEMVFHDAWTDTSKKQNAYDQLMKLTMAGWDIDTYIATFERLALAAGWALDAEGTIVRFREGLSKGIHCKALDRDKIPRTMDEWKATARTEVTRAKEKYNAGLTNTQRHNQQTRHYNTTQTPHRAPTQNNSNPNIVPMDVDATTTTNFKKLTPEEHTQLAKEGRCFRCRLQGHVACNCPKNTNTQTKVRETTTNKPVNTTTAPKLTKAQQIRVLEESMAEEERVEYLDARDMGQDFWSARA